MRTISTRTILNLLFIFGTLFQGFSQSTYLSSDKYPKWRLGLNGGGTWQTSDLKKNYAGLAGGFNIERILNRREDAPLGFSLGFRYLSGNSTGYDNTKNDALEFNQALNGTHNSIVRYDSTPGYFYNNYFTHLAEGDLELKLNFPAMEKRTRFIFHVFGGLGVTKYKTRINALDDSSHVYDFTKLPASPSVSNVKSFYNSGNATFETYADGNNKDGSFVFTPSLGIGVGIRFSKHVAFVIEHKVSFPFTNTLDGQQYAASSPKPLKNDIYHYTAANLIFTIWGRARGSYNTNPNTTTTNTTTVQTDPNTYTTANNQPKPIISIYSPSANPHTTTNPTQQVTGVAQYINSANQLNITINGSAPANGFSFNPNNGSFSFETYLAPGANQVNIVASSPAGQDNESLTINYANPQNPVVTNPTQIQELPPKVLITYPSNNYITSSPSVNVNASVANVSGSSNIAISANGYAITNFNFNPYNGSVSFVAPLIQGNNAVIVSAYNTAGNDAQQVFVTYNPVNPTTPVIIPPAEQKPVVSFNNPSSSPFQSINPVFYVTAHVSNVSSANQVNIQFNGMPVTNFTFNQYGFVNFTTNLNTGSNTVVVTGTNNAGSDTKTATINYKEAGSPPLVTIINPGVNPSASNSASANVIATVANVADQSNISVLVNNAIVPFTYNTSNQTVTIPVTLNVGMNTVKISAANNFGNDSKTQTIERKDAAMAKPVITILNPGVNPFATSVTPGNVLAQILNVNTSKTITITDGNNVAVPFTHNAAAQQIMFSPNLNQGANTFVITATNQAGSDTKSLTINYSVPVTAIPKPSVTIVNPASNPLITSDAQFLVKATTVNVNSQAEVTVSVNGAASNFTFNTITKEVEVPVNLNLGSNIITIAVSNQGGSDSKTQVIERFTQPTVLLPIVTVLNPQVSPFLSPTQTYTVTAEVLNVNTASDINITSGATAVPFTYDNVTHIVTFSVTLASGSNTYTIKGTNSGGSDSKTVVMTFMKKLGTATLLPKPVVTITNPGSANTTTLVPSQAIVATITNITSASQAAVLINGVPTSSFSYNNGAVTLTANLNLGNNTVTVTGTNTAGSDSKTVSITYNKSAVNAGINKPVVTITTPNTQNSAVANAAQTITATVTNVINASQVSVLVNGMATGNFSFNNGTVNFTANLNIGNNTVTITGTNAAGSDSKTVTILYNKTSVNAGIDKPVVTITNPGTTNSTVTSVSQNITATVTNVINASQVSVLVNGVATGNFSFSNGNVNLTANLNLGNNTVAITGTNTAGSDSKTVTILYNKTAVNTGIEKPVVIITTPSTVNSTVNTATQQVLANVTNVINATQVNVTVNGIAVPNFSFSNGNVSFTANLNIGNNTVTVTGTNAAGTDSKTISIQYNKTSVNAGIDKPVVTITTPAGNGITTTMLSTQPITATVTNVINATQVNVLVNNAPVTNFTFANGNVAFTANLTLGNNTVKITGTNAAGSDTKTAYIDYTKPRQAETGIDKPVVTFITPSTVNSTTGLAVQNIVATVTNVFTASQVNVQVNGTATTNFTFNNGTVTLNANLNIGNNTVTITGTNAAGYDSKTVTIVYNKLGGISNPGNLSPKPVVTITSNNGTTGNSTQTVTANITFITMSSQVSITVNGASVTTFMYNNGNVSFDANLNYGNNTVVITGTNTAGSDSKTVAIFRKMPPAPSITIIKPTESPFKTNKKEISVTATIQNVSSSSEINVVSDNGGTIPFTYNPNTLAFAFSYTLTNTYTTFTVSATNAGGNDSKTVTFKYEEPPRENATTDLITICHYPNGPNSTPQTIQIPTSDWATHQAHGDYQGSCATNSGGNNNGGNGNGNGNNNNNDPMITICHYPPGNTSNPQQIQIPTSAWPAHQAHGDSQGPCSTGSKPGNTTTPKIITTPKVEPPKTQTITPTTQQPKVTPATTTTTAPKATEPTTTPQTNSPRVIQPKKEETKPKEETKTEPKVGEPSGPAPRTIKPQ
jgi:hypothetical protein